MKKRELIEALKPLDDDTEILIANGIPCEQIEYIDDRFIDPFIIKKLKGENIENENLLFIDAGTVPENFTGKIRKENPTHLIIVDACLMDSNPGDMKIVDKDEFANIGISTHSMSLSFFVRYLEKDTEIRIIFVGIEPETMDWGVKPTPNVEKSADEFIETLKGIIV